MHELPNPGSLSPKCLAYCLENMDIIQTAYSKLIFFKNNDKRKTYTEWGHLYVPRNIGSKELGNDKSKFPGLETYW